MTDIFSTSTSKSSSVALDGDGHGSRAGRRPAVQRTLKLTGDLMVVERFEDLRMLRIRFLFHMHAPELEVSESD